MILFVFRFLLLSLSVCNIWKNCIYYKMVKLISKERKNSSLAKKKKYGRINKRPQATQKRSSRLLRPFSAMAHFWCSQTICLRAKSSLYRECPLRIKFLWERFFLFSKQKLLAELILKPNCHIPLPHCGEFLKSLPWFS